MGRKTISDLLCSLYDGRFFKQAAELHTSYSKPFLMLEGSFEELQTMVSNPKIICGALATVIMDYDISMFYSASIKETALALIVLAWHLGRERRTGPLLRNPIKKWWAHSKSTWSPLFQGLGQSLPQGCLRPLGRRESYSVQIDAESLEFKG